MKQSKRQKSQRQVESLETRIAMAANALVPVVGNWDGAGGDSVGLFDGTSGKLYLKNANSTGFADVGHALAVKNSAIIPLAGDWNGDGVTTAGTYDPTTGTFALRNRASRGAADAPFVIATSAVGGTPIVGDWDGDGKDSVGLFDPSTGQYLLKNELTSGAADYVFSLPPSGNMIAITGDWDGNGSESVGVVNAATGQVQLTNGLVAPVVEQTFTIAPFTGGDVVITGDWNGDGRDTVGVYRTSTGMFALDSDGSPGVVNNEFYIVPGLDISLQPAPTEKSSKSSGKAKGPVLAGLPPVLDTAQVAQLLDRASAATASENAIIAVVDRGGNILGVRMEQGVLDDIPDVATRVFAIDGAVAKARTAAFFANGDPTNDKKGTIGPLTSRTVRFISQSTVTQREVESNPNDDNLNSPLRGPGFVAPIGLGGHFPPGIRDAPQVDLFAIEHTNRDSILHPGADGIKGNGDDIPLPSRFNVPLAFIPPGVVVNPPESFGLVSGLMPNAQARGIATLPGGIPLYELDDFGRPWLVGGIGVFFPGLDGFATHEQAFDESDLEQSEFDRTNAPLVLEAEYIAAVAAGAIAAPAVVVPPVADIFFPPKGRIDLAGITLELIGPGSTFEGGIRTVKKLGERIGPAANGTSGIADQFLSGTSGQIVPDGWLVLPHASPLGTVTAADVIKLVDQGVTEAFKVRAQIRLQITKPPSQPIPGATTRMVFAVSDEAGNVLGIFRMQDATFFSIDVAVAKSRNVAYYANPAELQPIDRVDDNHNGIPDPSVPAGTAFTNRTFRFLAEGRFPSGIDGTQPGAFSIMFDPGFRNDLLESRNPRINQNAVYNAGAPLPASVFQSVLGFDAFTPGRNFHDPFDIANQNGVVFFPGSTPLYQQRTLIGGFGVSGDGVDQDDVVTNSGARGFAVPDTVLRADQVKVRNVRLPFIKFSRNPRAL